MSDPSIARYLSKEIIDFAKKVGISGPKFDEAVRTKDSGDPRDVVVHRGLETHLKKNYGHDSPTYKKNSEILHKHDKSW